MKINILVFLTIIQIYFVFGESDDGPNFQLPQVISSSSSIDSDTFLSQSKCEPLNTNILSLCKDIAYNETRFPNFMKQRTQQEAATDIANFLPLVKINCSPVLKLFLCSLYAPPCVKNYSSTLRPCREMCVKVKSGCEQFVRSFTQFNWPQYLECDLFPSFNGPEACVTDENYHNTPTINLNNNDFGVNFLSSLNSHQQQLLFNSIGTNTNNMLTNGIQNRNFYQYYAAIAAAAAAAAASNVRVKFACPPVLQIVGPDSNKNTYYLIVNDEVINNCAMPCDNTIFEKNEISFARSWILVWSSVCFASTLFTILTFLIERSRFRYPERPIIFLSGCYLIVSLGYLIGSSSLNSNAIVCKPLRNGLMQTRDYLIQGVENIPCTLLFMLIYFFSMSSSIWWVVLTLTWFLAAGLKWGHEAIENVSSYFHLAAWAIPGVKLIAILWLQKVDADILSGVCYTGIRNANLMRGFLLAPLIFYLILGSCFLFAGFVSLFRIRTVMKIEGNKTDKLEKFMVRICVFSILYMVPAIIVICCYVYEQSSYNKWIDYWLKVNYMDFNVPPDYVATSIFETDRSAIVFSLFMAKYAMLLIVGITSGFWIWSHKTLSSWQRFIERIFNCFGAGLGSKYKNEAAV